MNSSQRVYTLRQAPTITGEVQRYQFICTTLRHSSRSIDDLFQCSAESSLTVEVALQIHNESPLPIIILSAYHDSEFVERARKENVLAFLVEPLSDQSLKTSITLAMHRFKEFQVLQQ